MKKLTLALLLSIIGATPAFAHLNPAEHGSFAAGFSHPLFGVDHILAMVGVGLWAALLGGRALWLTPLAFVVTMMAGFGLAHGECRPAVCRACDRGFDGGAWPAGTGRVAGANENRHGAGRVLCLVSRICAWRRTG
jgi:hypothetical protein